MSANLYEILVQGHRNCNRPVFLHSGRGEVSYADFLQEAGRIATHLRLSGVGPGDRVVVQAAKSTAMVALYLATLQVGAVFVPLNSAYKRAEVDYFLEDAEPRLFIQDPAELAR